MKVKNNQKIRNQIFAGSFYTFFVNGIITIIIGSLLPYIRDAHELSYKFAGLLISTHSVGALISSYLGGVLPLYIGRRRSIVFFSSLGVVGFLLMITTGNHFLLALAFAFTGLNRGAVSNFNNAIINEIATGEGWALNLLHSIFAIGAFIAPFITMLFVRKDSSAWIYVAVVVAILCVIEVIVYARMPIPNEDLELKNKKSKRSKNKIDWGFLKNKYYLVAVGIMFTYLMAEQAFNGWLITYFTDSGIMSDNLAQVMASLLWFVILFGRLLYGYFSKSVEKTKLLLVGGTGYLIFMVFLIQARATSPVVIGIIGVGLFMSGIYPTTVASVGHITKEYPMALSVMLTTAVLGSIIMPLIIGTVADSMGIIGGMSVVIIAVVVTFLLTVYNRYIYRGVDEV